MDIDINTYMDMTSDTYIDTDSVLSIHINIF